MLHSKNLDNFLEDREQLQEFADVRTNKNDLIGWGIYIPEKDSVVILGRKEDEQKVRKLLTLRKEKGRSGEVMVPIFRPHGGLSIQED
jgi:hypothetical protein